MKFDILKQVEMPLLGRTRVTLTLEHTGSRTPSVDEATKAVAAQMKAPAENLVVRHIYPLYGQRTSKIIVHLYKDKETKERLEGSPTHGKEEKAQEQKAQ